MPIRGQSRRAQTLGADDPRSRRSAQGAMSEDILCADPVGINADGRITLIKGKAMIGDVLRWDGKEYVPTPVFKPTPAKTSAYRAKPGELVLCDPTSAGFTVTLEQASACLGLPICIKNYSASANTITISPSGTDTIDGLTSASIAAAYAAILLVPFEKGWIIV